MCVYLCVWVCLVLTSASVLIYVYVHNNTILVDLLWFKFRRMYFDYRVAALLKDWFSNLDGFVFFFLCGSSSYRLNSDKKKTINIANTDKKDNEFTLKYFNGHHIIPFISHPLKMKFDFMCSKNPNHTG